MVDRDNKTEEPTEKKLQESQEQGQFAKTEEFGVIFLLSAIACFMLFYGKSIGIQCIDYAKNIWLHFNEFEGTSTQAIYYIRHLLQCGTGIILGFLGLCILSAILSGGLQSGFKLSPKALKIHWERINPTNNLQRLFSLRKFLSMP